MKKKQIATAVAVLAMTLATASTSHAWFGSVDVNTSVSANNRTDSHNINNSKNTGIQSSTGASNDSGNHASSSSGGGWGWGGWGWGGGSGASASSSNTSQGSNFGLMGNGGNTVGSHTQTLGDTIITGSTYNGTDVLRDREITAQTEIQARKEVDLKKFAK